MFITFSTKSKALRESIEQRINKELTPEELYNKTVFFMK